MQRGDTQGAPAVGAMSTEAAPRGQRCCEMQRRAGPYKGRLRPGHPAQEPFLHPQLVPKPPESQNMLELSELSCCTVKVSRKGETLQP